MLFAPILIRLKVSWHGSWLNMDYLSLSHVLSYINSHSILASTKYLQFSSHQLKTQKHYCDLIVTDICFFDEQPNRTDLIHETLLWCL